MRSDHRKTGWQSHKNRPNFYDNSHDDAYVFCGARPDNTYSDYGGRVVRDNGMVCDRGAPDARGNGMVCDHGGHDARGNGMVFGRGGRVARDNGMVCGRGGRVARDNGIGLWSWWPCCS